MEEKRSIKGNWNKVDEVCPNCNQVTKVATGLTKQNVKKLFRKPTLNDIIIFVLLILTLVGAYSYQSEVQQYKDIIRDPQELCTVYYDSIAHGNFQNQMPYPFTFHIQRKKLF